MSIFSTLFGGSKSKSKSTSSSQSVSSNQSGSSNDAFPWLMNTFGSQASQGVQANSFLSHLLGLGGDPAADDAFNKYLGSTDYNFMFDNGVRAINGNRAAHGLFNSGATAKALTKFGQGTGQQYFKDYLDRLLGLTQQGIGAGGLIAGAGGRSFGTGTSNSSSIGDSTSNSSSSPGIAAFLGQAMSAAAGMGK